jgi:hypothetical protein
MAVGANQPAVINAQVSTTTGGIKNALNLSATTLIKGSRGYVCQVNVTTAGSTNGAIYDSSASGTIGATKLVAVVPEAVGTYFINFPCLTGIVFVPGTSMVASISFA